MDQSYVKVFGVKMPAKSYKIYSTLMLFFLVVFFLGFIITCSVLAFSNTTTQADQYLTLTSGPTSVTGTTGTNDINNNDPNLGSSFKLDNRKVTLQDATGLVNCVSANAEIVNGVCQCKNNFYGTICQKEKFSSNYSRINISNIDVTTTNVKSTITTQLSFNENSCTTLCDNNNDCAGVKYENKICTQFNKIIFTNAEIDNNSVYFLKMKSAHIGVDALYGPFIYLSSYEMTVLTNVWSDTKNGDKIIINNVPTCYKLTFVPKSVFIGQDCIALYTNYKVSSSEFDHILKNYNNGDASRTVIKYTHGIKIINYANTLPLYLTIRTVL